MFSLLVGIVEIVIIAAWGRFLERLIIPEGVHVVIESIARQVLV